MHWDLLTSMTSADVRLVIQHALEVLEITGTKPGDAPRKAPRSGLQIVSDNGVQFTSRDFKQLVRQFELEHIRIRTYHPESNGVLERFHRSTREEISEEGMKNLVQARQVIARWVEHYNTERLHAGLGYLAPVDYYSGSPEERLEERRIKLARARRERRRLNEERLQLAA